MIKNLYIVSRYLVLLTFAAAAHTAAFNEPQAFAKFLADYQAQLPHFVDDLAFFKERATLLRARPNGTDIYVTDFFACLKIDETKVEEKKVKTLNIAASTAAFADKPPMPIVFEMLKEDYDSFWQSKFHFIDGSWPLRKKVIVCRGTLEALRSMGHFFETYGDLMKVFYRALGGASADVVAFLETAPRVFSEAQENWSTKLARFELAENLEGKGAEFKPMQSHPKARPNRLKTFWKTITMTSSSEPVAHAPAIALPLPRRGVAKDQVVPMLELPALTPEESEEVCLFPRHRDPTDNDEGRE